MQHISGAQTELGELPSSLPFSQSVRQIDTESYSSLPSMVLACPTPQDTKKDVSLKSDSASSLRKELEAQIALGPLEERDPHITLAYFGLLDSWPNSSSESP